MLVSAIIPHFNRPEKLRRAVRSVMGQARPDGVSLELIVVDDASPAGCDLSFLDDLANVRLIRHEANRGAAAARNTAIEAARGEFIAQLDSDDAWLPSFVASQLAFWEAQGGRSCEDALVVTGGSIRVRTGRWLVYHPVEPNSASDMARGCSFSPGSSLFAGSPVFRRHGLYETSLERLEDYEWLLRFGLKGGRLRVNPEVLCVVEPSSGVDPAQIAKVCNTLQQLVELEVRKQNCVRRNFEQYLDFSRFGAAWLSGRYVQAGLLASKEVFIRFRLPRNPAPIVKRACTDSELKAASTVWRIENTI